jgi:hypothetical protein
MRKLLLPVSLLLCSYLCFSQQKTVAAHKVVAPPRIDGNLDDAAWQNATVSTDFIQNFPNPGNPATLKTEVRIIYDDNAVYVGAYLYDDPSLIRKQITARDEEQQSDVDYFSIFFDTYNDKQNGFQFLVTSTNVQTDARLGPNLGGDFGEYGDKSWDAVWDSKVSMKNNGWVVEMMIPYLALRFSKQEVQDWGLQLLRFTRRNNETSFWNFVNPEVNGFVNQFGLMTGLQNLQPPLRLSFSPYVSTGVRNTPLSNGKERTEWLRSGGMDVKYGINESFTLDATLIPDFGQVVSDNVVNNLTPFEVFFTENRPFFTEGTEIFNKSGLFYSRRVGATPSRYYSVKDLYEADTSVEIRKNPTITQLYNAIKFSGRTKNRLGIGVFNAVAAPMNAIIQDRQTGVQTKIETEPLTNYNVIVLDQALRGRSFVTLTNTNVLRNGNARDANVTAFDYSFFDKKNMYNIRGTGRYSKIFTANPYDGFAATVRAGKVSGQWQYNAQFNVESDRYNPRDLGFLQSPNEITYSANASYRQFNPTKNFLSYNYNINFRYNRLYNPNAFSEFFLQGRAFWFLKNFWDVSFTLGSTLKNSHDYFVLGQPTAGLYVQRPAFHFAQIEGSTDSRKKLYFSYSYLLGTFNDKTKGTYFETDFGVRYRFSNRLSLEISNNYEKENDYIIQPDTIDAQPLMAFVDFDDVTTILSGIYHFAPRVNLTLRARHYWSKVIHNTLANVDAKGNPVNRNTAPAYLDQNENVFNIDAFFTWDFRLGSRLIVGYKNWIGEDEKINGFKNRSYTKNLGQVFNLRHGNELTARFIYFLDYNQLRKKR